MAVLDVDNFKAVNDGNGHHAGDSVLLIVADRILQCLRESDLLSRFGGDEFAILFPQTDAEGALDVAERIREIVAASAVDVDGERVRATVSIGVATQDEADGTNWERVAGSRRTRRSTTRRREAAIKLPRGMNWLRRPAGDRCLQDRSTD